MPARIVVARRKATELLEKAGIRKAPVPLEKLLSSVNATIQYEPFSGQLYGMVHRNKDGSAVIGVNSTDAPNRRRFTIAHEIGHLVLHKDETLHIDERYPIGLRTDESSLATNDSEIEANQFAAELLMPMSFLKKDIEKLPPELEVEEAISTLAKMYQVSTQAMTIRLTASGFLTQ